MTPPRIVPMYHSVAPRGSELLGTVAIDPRRFRDQIRLLRERGFAFAFLSAITKPVLRPTAYLSFDDGTVDQIRYALPVLEDEEVPGHISLLSGPWAGEWPVAHLAQVALALNANGLMELPGQLASFPEADEVYHYELDPTRRQFKYLVNFVLRPEEARSLLRGVGQYLQHRFIQVPPESSFLEFGVHGVSHIPWDGSAGYFENEVQKAWHSIHGRTKQAVKVFTFPQQPRAPGTWENLVPELKQGGWLCAATTMPSLYSGGFLVERIDAAHLEDFLDG